MFQLDGPTLVGVAAVLGSVSNIIVALRQKAGGGGDGPKTGRDPALGKRRLIARRRQRPPALPPVR